MSGGGIGPIASGLQDASSTDSGVTSANAPGMNGPGTGSF